MAWQDWSPRMLVVARTRIFNGRQEGACEHGLCLVFGESKPWRARLGVSSITRWPGFQVSQSAACVAALAAPQCARILGTRSRPHLLLAPASGTRATARGRGAAYEHPRMVRASRCQASARGPHLNHDRACVAWAQCTDSDGMQRTPTEGSGGSAVETEAGLRMIAHLHESLRTETGLATSGRRVVRSRTGATRLLHVPPAWILCFGPADATASQTQLVSAEGPHPFCCYVYCFSVVAAA
jgi:hypothetical protein